MSEIASTYTPASVEGKWYDYWIRHDCFTAHPERVSERRPAYSIVIPPPNVTGMLTLGHVLNNTIQDILARRARMLGKEVLWLPGTDHCGIATTSGARRSSRKSGTGRTNTAASFCSNCARLARRATGRARDSPWTKRIRAAFRACS